VVDRSYRSASLVASRRVPAIAHELGRQTGERKAAEKTRAGQMFATRRPVNKARITLAQMGVTVP
jgi:hypothetical protein